MKQLFAISLMAGILMSSPVLAASSDSSDSDTANASYLLAEKAVKAKNYGEAVSLLEPLLRDDSSNANAWNYLAFSHRKLGELKKAEAEYKKALILQSNHKGAHEYLGELYVETGRMHLAVQLLGRLKQICGIDCEEYEALEIVINDAKGS
ncbi:MAG: tetratricopeptide repeat protein [Alphaproteobacteria bacterium]|nr:tetratricopeptide repeat protein [Alphaproteobacteria bacterium]